MVWKVEEDGSGNEDEAREADWRALQRFGLGVKMRRGASGTGSVLGGCGFV